MGPVYIYWLPANHIIYRLSRSFQYKWRCDGFITESRVVSEGISENKVRLVYPQEKAQAVPHIMAIIGVVLQTLVR